MSLSKQWGPTIREARGPQLPFDMYRIVSSAVEDAVEDVESSYEAYTTNTLEPGGRGFRFGSGSDGGVGGEAITTLGHMSGSGGWPNNSKLNGPLLKAESDAYDYAKDEWMRANKAFLAENGIPQDKVNYHDLHELGFSSEAEDLSEYEMEAQNDETITFRLGAFYYGPDNSREGRKGEENMYVFALVDFDGHFLPGRLITTFETTFAFKDLRDLKVKLIKALKAAVKSLD